MNNNNLKSRFMKVSAAAAVGLGVLFSQAAATPAKANDALRDILENFALNVCIAKKMESDNGEPSEAEAAASIILDEYRENRPYEYPALAAYAQENWEAFEREVAIALCTDEGPREGRQFRSSHLPFVLIMPNDYSRRHDDYYYEGHRHGYRQHRGYDGWRERQLKRELRRERREDAIEDRRQQQQRQQWLQERRRLQQQKIQQQHENERLRRELRRERLEDRQKPKKPVVIGPRPDRDRTPDVRDRRERNNDGPKIRPQLKERFEGRRPGRNNDAQDRPRPQRDFNRGGNDKPNFQQLKPGKPDKGGKSGKWERRPKP